MCACSRLSGIVFLLSAVSTVLVVDGQLEPAVGAVCESLAICFLLRSQLFGRHVPWRFFLLLLQIHRVPRNLNVGVGGDASGGALTSQRAPNRNPVTLQRRRAPPIVCCGWVQKSLGVNSRCGE